MINFRTVLKIGVAAALLSLAFYLDLIDLTLFNLLDWVTPLAVCALLFSALILSSIRWLILLQYSAPNLQFSRVLRINFIGMFFNLFLPGGVGGDLVRARYIITEIQENKSAGVVSILFDRYIGLLALFYVAIVLTTFLLDGMMANPILSAIAATIYVGALVITIALFGGLYCTGVILRWNILKVSKKDNQLKTLTRKLLAAIAAYRNRPKANTFAILCSLASQSCVMFAIVSLANGLGFSDLSGSMVALGAAIASLVSIVPITPGGLGVGEAAFAVFCNLYTGDQLAKGAATIFFVFRGFTVLFALLGGIIFISFKPVTPVAAPLTGSQSDRVLSSNAPKNG